MGFKLGPNSDLLLRGVHPDLAKVIRRAAEISKVEFKVLEGRRSIARQRELVKKGASKTMKSRHIHGFAVDIAPVVGGVIRWDWPLYYPLAETVKQAAKDVGVAVEWGGDWKSFKDGPHWQLPARKYPDPK
jgi:peptidoglycan L-alanyl-D-glutamate endopeptidase CwlK